MTINNTIVSPIPTVSKTISCFNFFTYARNDNILKNALTPYLEISSDIFSRMI